LSTTLTLVGVNPSAIMNHKIRITVASLVTVLFLSAMSAAGVLNNPATTPAPPAAIHVVQSAQPPASHFEPVESND
jgi:hypothetical protein